MIRLKMFATRNLRRNFSKPVSCLLQSSSRAMDPRRSLPTMGGAAREGSACLNRELARHHLQYPFEGPATRASVLLDRLGIMIVDSDEEFIKQNKEAVLRAEEAECDFDEYTDTESVAHGKPKLCQVCMKVVHHHPYHCPLLTFIRNPENTLVGEGYKIFCRLCHKWDHGHPDGTWTGYAFKESWRTMDTYYEEWTSSDEDF